MIDELITDWRVKQKKLEKELNEISKKIVKLRELNVLVEVALSRIVEAIRAVKELEYGSPDKWDERIKKL